MYTLFGTCCVYLCPRKTIKKQNRMIRNVTSEEMEEIFKGLKEQGWNPQWCDTPVPLFDSVEKAEKFMESGDITPDGYVWLPEEPTDEA